MSIRSFRPLLLLAVLVSTPQLTWADTFFYDGVEIKLPDEGYMIKSGRMASLINKEKKGFVEVYQFSKVPAATKEKIAELMKPRKNTTGVRVIGAKEFKQHGVDGTAAEGVAKIHGVNIRFLLVAIPVKDHAICAVAFMRRSDEKIHREELEGILRSIKEHTSEDPREPS